MEEVTKEVTSVFEATSVFDYVQVPVWMLFIYATILCFITFCLIRKHDFRGKVVDKYGKVIGKTLTVL